MIRSTRLIRPCKSTTWFEKRLAKITSNGGAGSARELFQTHQDFEEARMVLGNERKNQVLKAVLDQAWTGITDYSQDWFKVSLETA